MNTYGFKITDLSLDEFIEVARTCHELNRVYTQATSGPDADSAASNPALLPWDELDRNTIEAAFDGVAFHFRNPDATPENSHENWLKLKRSQGWVYGVKKDANLKTNPCMVPYADLSLDMRVKDHLFIAAIEQSLRLLAFAKKGTTSDK